MTSMLYNWQRFILQCNDTVVSSLFFHSLSFLPSSELLLFIRSFPLPFHVLLEDLIGWGHIMHSAKPEQIKFWVYSSLNWITTYQCLHLLCTFLVFLSCFLSFYCSCLLSFSSVYSFVSLYLGNFNHFRLLSLLSVVKTHFLISSPGRVILYN